MQDVLAAVRSNLAREPRLGGLDALALVLRDGVLTIEGTVEDVEQKKLVLERCAATPGVQGIVDRLHVRPRRALPDGAIAARVCEALRREPLLRGLAVHPVGKLEDPGRLTIGVHVEQGLVTLDGAVPSLRAKRVAGVLAWWVEGTADVINGLEVVADEEDTDATLTSAVRLVLDRDPSIDPSGVDVSARHGVVTLHGSVRSERERRIAERDAWCVFGVDDVRSELAIERSGRG